MDSIRSWCQNCSRIILPRRELANLCEECEIRNYRLWGRLWFVAGFSSGVVVGFLIF